MLAVLRQRNFLLLFCGAVVSQTGDWVLFTALPFYVYARTGSVLSAGAIFFLETVPTVLLGSLAGVFVDRWDRKHTIVIGSILSGLGVLLLLGVHGVTNLWLVYAMALFNAAVAQFVGPAGSAALPCVVGDEHVAAANAALNSANNLARLIGPSVGGALMASAGLTPVAIVDALSFLGAALAVALVSAPFQASRFTDPGRSGHTNQEPWRIWDDWLEGFRVVTGQWWIAILFAVMAIAVLGDGMLTVLIAPFVKSTLGASAAVFGWILTARGLGGLAGSLVMPLWHRFFRPAHMLAYSITAGAVMFGVMTTVAQVWATLTLMIVMAVVGMAFWIVLPSILQREVPDDVRGRIFGAFRAVNASMVLIGSLAGSALAEVSGIRPSMLVACGLYALSGAIAFFWLPMPARESARSSHYTAARVENER